MDHQNQQNLNQQQQNLKQFVQDWKNNEKLQNSFGKNPEKICSQYQITGENKQAILEAAKSPTKEGKDLKERVSTVLMRLMKTR